MLTFTRFAMIAMHRPTETADAPSRQHSWTTKPQLRLSSIHLSKIFHEYTFNKISAQIALDQRKRIFSELKRLRIQAYQSVPGTVASKHAIKTVIPAGTPKPTIAITLWIALGF